MCVYQLCVSGTPPHDEWCTGKAWQAKEVVEESRLMTRLRNVACRDPGTVSQIVIFYLLVSGDGSALEF